MKQRTLPVVLGALALAAAQVWGQAKNSAGPGEGAAPAVRAWGPPAIGHAAAPATVRAAVTHAGLFTTVAPEAGALRIEVDLPRLAEIASTPGAFIIAGFPLSATETADLVVERFWVTNPNTRFVVGAAAGADQPLNFDPASVVLLRGHVAGSPRSSVFLGIAEEVTNGIIDFGPGGARYGVSSRPRTQVPVLPGQLIVFPANAGGPNPVPTCHLIERPIDPADGPEADPRRGLRQIEVAVETDHEFFQLFGSETATAAYIVQLYGVVSDIFMREINVRIDLTFARVFPEPNEPFQASQTVQNSLNVFRAFWENNMGHVPRDTAQMFSGRADLPGGVAYLPGMCGTQAYSFCGNAVGYFADPASSSVLNYDPLVTAHELGHNFGTNHTDAYGLDNCHLVEATPQRGSIMSYCNQTVSGAMSVIDLGFHTRTRRAMLEEIPSASCVVFDCNQNSRDDAIDIAMGFSQDANFNGIPDECEDCNHNQVLDSLDILNGTSQDLNANGIPDECEPDCNGNMVPDDRDILLGTSQDLHGDGVPDECDADLNGNMVSDYNEIMADMPLDRNRNRTLDAFEDCDNDQVPDLVELEGAHNAWVVSGDNCIREYHAVTGVLMNASPGSSVAGGQDLIITPDRRILVSGSVGVLEFDRTGAPVRLLVPVGTGGLSQAGGLLLSRAGTLLVASGGNAAVLEFDLATGAFIRAFVASGSGGLVNPYGLTYGPNGNLFVSSSTANNVLEFDGETGAFVRTVVTGGSGGLNGARGLVFNPVTGDLLVASSNGTQVKAYNPATGAYLGNWLVTGLPVERPWCLRVGRDGMIYISRGQITDTHVTRARLFIFDPRNGNFVRAYVQAQDSLLVNPRGFDFMPGDTTDCNFNTRPDNCDIASGYSVDANHNGVPDECERACYANCDLSTIPPVLNVNDFICFQTAFITAMGLPPNQQATHYANCDGSLTPPVLNVNDFICFQSRFAAGCR